MRPWNFFFSFSQITFERSLELNSIVKSLSLTHTPLIYAKFEKHSQFLHKYFMYLSLSHHDLIFAKMLILMNFRQFSFPAIINFPQFHSILISNCHSILFWCLFSINEWLDVIIGTHLVSYFICDLLDFMKIFWLLVEMCYNQLNIIAMWEI